MMSKMLLFITFVSVLFTAVDAAEMLRGQVAHQRFIEASMLAIDSGNPDLIRKTANSVQRYLYLNQFTDKNRPDKLVNLQARMINYLSVQDKLSRCQSGKRNLATRYLNNALSMGILSGEQTQSNTEDMVFLSEGNWVVDNEMGTCQKTFYSTADPIIQFSADVVEVVAFSEEERKSKDTLMPERKVLEAQEGLIFQTGTGKINSDLFKKYELQKDIFINSLKNSARNLADLEYRYSNKSSEDIAKSVVAKICPELCDDDVLTQVKDSISKQLVKSKESTDRKGFGEVAKVLCRKLDILKDSVPIYEGCETGNIFGEQKMIPGSDTIAQFDQSMKRKFGAKICYSYFQEKLKMSSSGIGLLFVAEPLSHTNLDCKQPQSLANRKLVSESVQYLKDSSLSFAQSQRENLKKTLSASSMIGRPNYSKIVVDNIKEMMKISPAAVGQALISDPRYSSMTCDLIKAIEEDDKFQEKVDKAIMIGGAIVGGVLTVASVVAPPLGIPAAIVSNLTIGAASVSLASAGYSVNESLRQKGIEEDIRNSIMAANGDFQSFEEQEKARQLKFAAATSAIVDSVFLGVDVATAYKAVKATQGGAKVIAEVAEDSKGALSLTQKTAKEAQEGNAWLKNWYGDAQTQNKIKNLNGSLGDKLMGYSRNIKKNASIGEFAEIPSAKELELIQQSFPKYDVNRQFKGLFIPDEARYPASLRGRTFIFNAADNPMSTAIHEGTHKIMKGDQLYNQKAIDLLESPFKSRGQIYREWGIAREDAMRTSTYLDQISEAHETHARVNQLRAHYNLKPSDVVDDAFIDKMMTEGLASQTPVTKNFFDIIGDKKALKQVFNSMFGVGGLAVVSRSALETP